MKILTNTLFFILIFTTKFYTQTGEFTNIITALEVLKIESNVISIQWKSDVPKGTFSIFYNTQKPIQSNLDIKESELVFQTNLEGTKVGTLYLYQQELFLSDKGAYYFAVVLNQSFDGIAEGVINVLPQENSALIPSLNTMVQPIIISDIPEKKVEWIQKNSYFLNNGYVITSLDVEKDLDYFRLRWFVYPKDLDQYVFIIYRSRYPIVNYTSSQGLPEYARVTNAFYFEDRNISVETPYYYAVVPELNRQWQRGINVLEYPAVILKESPLFEIIPTIEYVKSKEKLPIKKPIEILSEEDIQLAVQRTLSNLQILPVYRSNQSDIEVTKKSLTEQEVSNFTILSNFLENSNPNEEKVTPKLGLSQVEEDVSEFLSQTKKELLLLRKNTLTKQQKAEEEFLKNESAYYKNLVKQINDLSKKIIEHRNLEDQLLLSYQIPEDALKKKIVEFYKQRDLIKIDQFNIKSQILKRNSREEKLLSQLEYIKSQETNDLDTFLKNKIFTYQRKIDGYKTRFNNAKQNKKILEVSSPILSRFSNLNVNDPENNVNIQFGTVQPEFEKKTQNNYATLPEELEYQAINDFSWTNSILEELPEMLSSEDRLDKVRVYYEKITIESIPDIEELPKEKWISQKEIWKKNNKQVWIDINKAWRQRVIAIIGPERYADIRNKWFSPSSEVAIRESAKAFQQEKYDEALYLQSFIANDSASIMLLGRTFFELGSYRDAYSVFIVAYKMGIPESQYWLDLTAEKLIGKKIVEN